MARSHWPAIVDVISGTPGIDKEGIASRLDLPIHVLTRELASLRNQGTIRVERETKLHGQTGRPRELFFPPPSDTPGVPGEEASVPVTMQPDAPGPDAAPPAVPGVAPHDGGGNGAAAAPVAGAPFSPRTFAPTVQSKVDRESGLELGREADQVMKVVRAVKGSSTNALATVERIGPAELEDLGETGILDANVQLSEIEDPREFTRRKWGGGAYRWTMRMPSGQPIAGAVVVFRVAGDFIPTSAGGRRHLLDKRDEERRMNPGAFPFAAPPPVTPTPDPMFAAMREQAARSDRLLETILTATLGRPAAEAKPPAIDPIQLQTMIDSRVSAAVADTDRRWNERVADIKDRHAEEIRRLESSHRLELKHVETNARMEEQAKNKGGSFQDRVLEIPRVADALADLVGRATEKKLGLEVDEGPGDWSDVIKNLVSQVGQPALESFIDAAATRLRGGGPPPAKRGPTHVRALPGPTAAAPAAAAPPPASDGAATVGEPPAAAGAEPASTTTPPASVQAAQAAAVARVNTFLDALEREYAVRSRPEGFWDLPASGAGDMTNGELWDALPGKVREPIEQIVDRLGADEDLGAVSWKKFAEAIASHPAVVRMTQVAGQDPAAAEWLGRVFGAGPWIPDFHDGEEEGAGEGA